MDHHDHDYSEGFTDGFLVGNALTDLPTDRAGCRDWLVAMLIVGMIYLFLSLLGSYTP